MTRGFRFEPLPAPLRAVAELDERGDLCYVIALGLTPQQRKDAIRRAREVARQAGWLRGLAPVPLLAWLPRPRAGPGAPAAAHGLAAAVLALSLAGGIAAGTMALAPPSGRPGGGSLPAAETAPARAAHGRRQDPSRSPAAAVPASPGKTPGGPVQGLLNGAGKTVKGVQKAVTQARCAVRKIVQGIAPLPTLPPVPVPLPTPLPTEVLPPLPCVRATPTASPAG
jgi:hypothetical protein